MGAALHWPMAQFKKVNYEVPPDESKDLSQNACACAYVSILLYGIVTIKQGAEWIITITPYLHLYARITAFSAFASGEKQQTSLLNQKNILGSYYHSLGKQCKVRDFSRAHERNRIIAD